MNNSGLIGRIGYGIVNDANIALQSLNPLKGQYVNNLDNTFLEVGSNDHQTSVVMGLSTLIPYTRATTSVSLFDETLGIAAGVGRRGGLAHANRVAQAESILSKQSHLEHVAGGSLPELRRFGALKLPRFSDLIFRNKNTGGYIGLQVGRTTQSGLPISRERAALQDLRNTGFFDHLFFIKY